MRCSAFHDRINELLDERLDPSEDTSIKRHAVLCDDCRAELKGYQMFVNVLDRGQRTKTLTKNNHKNVARRIPGIWLAMAATILFAVTFLPRQMPTQQSAPVLAQATPPSSVAAEQTATPQAAGPGGSNFVQPILGLSLVATADWSSLEPVEMPFGVQMPQMETEWLQVVADEMVPIKQSVDSTVSLIMRSLST